MLLFLEAASLDRHESFAFDMLTLPNLALAAKALIGASRVERDRSRTEVKFLAAMDRERLCNDTMSTSVAAAVPARLLAAAR